MGVATSSGVANCHIWGCCSAEQRIRIGNPLHNDVHKDNAEAPIKRQVVGREVGAAEGRLDLGTWKQIACGQFDQRRRKGALVKIIGK